MTGTKLKIVVISEQHVREFSTGMKRVEDAIRELNDYADKKYGGKRR